MGVVAGVVYPAWIAEEAEMDAASFRTRVERDTAQHGGYLRCETCGLTVEVDAAYWRTGWPTCHGYTMRWWTRRQIDAGEVPEVARR